jgi:phthiodiolone/phenolphthiodiolone dimycocerosates ketoreductase
MTSTIPRVSLGYNMNLAVSPHDVADFARAAEASGVVDEIACWDQLCLAWPHFLWGEDITPLAKDVPDNANFCDVFVLAGIITAVTEKLGIALTPDAARRGPAELMQSMLTVAAAARGRGATLMIGAGEIKNLAPFGWPAKGNFDKLEDCLQIFNKFMDNADEPFDFEGKYWQLKDAWIGTARARPFKPTVYALGGGPRVINAAAKYADGLITAIPLAFPTPEQWGEEIRRVKKMLEELGRDPEAFTFGFNAVSMIHHDSEALEDACRNPLNQYVAALVGRFNPAEWQNVGQKAVVEDYHYALDMLPQLLSREVTQGIIDQANPDMVRETFLTGSPAEVAGRIQDYLDVGSTYVFLWDQIQFTRPLSERNQIWENEIEVARLLKKGS